MGFLDDLAKLVQDRDVRRLAERRARSRELAEDALQDTFRAVAQTQNPEAINDLRAFFCKSLIRAINRQLALSRPVPAEDIGAIADSHGLSLSSGTSAPASVASEAYLRLLAEVALTRLERDRAELMAMVPARSGDPVRYQSTIIAAAAAILRLLFEGPVTPADWNEVLRSVNPQWCDEPELAHDAMYQRLSRARADVQSLLRTILPGTGSRPEAGPAWSPLCQMAVRFLPGRPHAHTRERTKEADVTIAAPDNPAKPYHPPLRINPRSAQSSGQ